MDQAELRRIGDSFLTYLQEHGGDFSDSLAFEDYHGFHIGNLPSALLEEKLRPFHLTKNDIEVEVVKVVSDLKSETHYHEGSRAFVHVLGYKEGFSQAEHALAYMDGVWREVKSGDGWIIDPKTIHGFSVEPGGILYFLSVQSPPIDLSGVDDYHRAHMGSNTA